MKRNSVALRRYLARHIEPDLPEFHFDAPRWQQVLVLPAYREPPELLARLRALPPGVGRTLVILVLNRPAPDGDAQANAALREAIGASVSHGDVEGAPRVCALNPHTDLYLYDLEALRGPTAAAHGVGLARKTGADIALRWMHAGGIAGEWLCSIDADATLPADYFAQLAEATPGHAAAVFPFRHVPGDDARCDAATALYELRLHHYVLGLEYAGSPYAFHTLGSCLAIRAEAYAQVRGFPKRAGGEDFYVLNKLAKVGPIARPRGSCIALQSRHSDRVPFGTGPAVRALADAPSPRQSAVFYHPEGFVALRAMLRGAPRLGHSSPERLEAVLLDEGISPPLARQAHRAMNTLGIADALRHCARQGASPPQFLRQFHQWFDGFRTLKFMHALRDAGWGPLSLMQLDATLPALWPVDGDSSRNIAALRGACAAHWGWNHDATD